MYGRKRLKAGVGGQVSVASTVQFDLEGTGDKVMERRCRVRVQYAIAPGASSAFSAPIRLLLD